MLVGVMPLPISNPCSSGRAYQPSCGTSRNGLAGSSISSGSVTTIVRFEFSSMWGFNASDPAVLTLDPGDRKAFFQPCTEPVSGFNKPPQDHVRIEWPILWSKRSKLEAGEIEFRVQALDVLRREQFGLYSKC